MSVSGPVPRRASDLYADKDLARFYDAQPTERLDFAFCEKMAMGAVSVLDLGCGTGELAARIARSSNGKKHIVGADPARAMLDIARVREAGDQVRWIEASAETLVLAERFDRIMLTGHAFQVFLTQAQQLSVLKTIARHLRPEGRFIFDTRNPAYPGRKERTREETSHRFEDAKLGTIETWNVSSYDEASKILTYTNGYRVLSTDQTYEAEDQIRYTAQSELADLMHEAGLEVEDWLGAWDGTAFHADAKEIIPIGRLAR